MARVLSLCSLFHVLLACSCLFSFFFFLMIRRPPRSALFRYTTRFRSAEQHILRLGVFGRHVVQVVGREQRRADLRSEEHTSELQSRRDLVCRLLLEKKKKKKKKQKRNKTIKTSTATAQS